MAEFVLESDGLAVLLEVLTSPDLCSLGGYVVFVLVNLTVSRSKRVQKITRERGVFEALEGFMKWLDHADEGIMGAFSPNETRQVVYQLLDNLLTANASNAMHFLQQSHLVEALRKVYFMAQSKGLLMTFVYMYLRILTALTMKTATVQRFLLTLQRCW